MASSKLLRSRSSNSNSSADVRKNFEHEGLELVEVKATGKELGRGSYASVIEVTLHGTIFAAKIVHAIIASQKNKEYFIDECVYSSKLRHPNIVQLIGIYYPSPTDELPWLVMELMPKGSLSSLIDNFKKEEKDIPWHYKLSILMNVCQGLQFLHTHGLTHRDLSSNNILLTKDYVAKIADLGLAKVIAPQDHQMLTQAPGTQAFMPPEALLDKPQYGTSLDVFSLGCVGIHLVSLALPIPEAVKQLDESGEMMTMQMTEFQRREKYLRKFEPLPPLRRLIEECLKDSPKERPVIGEVVKRLRNIHCDPLPHENDDILQLHTSLIDCEKQLHDKEQELAHSMEQIREKDKELVELAEQSKELSQMLASTAQQSVEKDQQLAKAAQQLNACEKQLLDKNALLTDYEIWLDEKEEKLARCMQEKDEALAKQSKLFSEEVAKVSTEKDEQLENAKQELKAKDEELTRNKNALSEKETNKVCNDYNTGNGLLPSPECCRPNCMN